MKKENEFPLAAGSEVRGLGTITAIEQEIPGGLLFKYHL